MGFVRFAAFLVLTTWPLFTSAQNFTFVNFSENQGLGAQLGDITQDNNGNLWMVGLLGQFYFHDGVETKTYSFPDHLFTNSIFRIAVDSNNKIWLLTDRGLISFDGETFQVQKIPAEFKPDFKNQMCVDSNNRIWMLDQNGKIGFTGAQGIRIFDYQDKFPGAIIRAMNLDENKNIWLASSRGLLIKVNENINSSEVKIPELVGKDIEAIDFMNHTLTVVADDSIYRLQDLKVIEKHALVNHDKRTEMVISDARSNVWILESGKLWKVVNGDKLWINESFGLTNNTIIRIFRDNRKFLWVLTDAKGTFRYSNQLFRKTSIPEEQIVSSVLPLDNSESVLLGTYGKGLFLKSPSGVKKVLTKTKLDQALVLGIKSIEPNSYFIATHGEGLFHLHTENQSFNNVVAIKPDQPEDVKFIRSMSVFGDSIVVGTKYGLSMRVHQSWVRLTGNSKLVVNCFLKISPQQFLIGSTEGLFLLKDTSLVRMDSSNFMSTGINTIKRDGLGNYWVGSNRKEIAVYDKNFSLLEKITLPFPSDGVFLIEFINNQTALIGFGGESATSMRIQYSPEYKITSHTIYGPSHGWPDPDLVLGASSSLRNGFIWIGTTSGAFQFNISADGVDESSPESYVSKVSLFNSSEDIHAFATGKLGFFRLPEELTLPFNLNNITIGFRANDLSDPRSILYRFRLNGLGSTWSDWTSQNEVIYSNLQPGSYNFEVQARNNRGVSGPSATYTFSIQPAFWQTWWFYLIVLSFLVIVFLGLNRLSYRMKIKSYKKQEDLKKNEAIRIKQQMSMDFHDELGNKLAGVMSYASALRHSSKNRELDAALEYIESNAQEIFHRTKDFIWAIDVESNNLLQVLIYLRDFGVNFFERNKITFDVKSNFDPEYFDQPLREGYNRQIILIFKEAMTNILKHANCKQVDFFASISPEGQVQIIIEDDGKGISSPTNSGSGLRNMKKRAAGINGAFELNKSDLGGLRISLEFKV